MPLIQGRTQLLQPPSDGGKAASSEQQKANPGAVKANHDHGSVATLKEGIIAFLKPPKSPVRASLPPSAP